MFSMSQLITISAAPVHLGVLSGGKPLRNKQLSLFNL